MRIGPLFIGWTDVPPSHYADFGLAPHQRARIFVVEFLGVGFTLLIDVQR